MTYRRMENIDGMNCSFALLLESKHQVDPLTQRLRDLIRLQSLSVNQDEESRVVPGPGRQVHVIHPLAVLTHAKVKTCQRGKWGNTRVTLEANERARLEYFNMH